MRRDLEETLTVEEKKDMARGYLAEITKYEDTISKELDEIRFSIEHKFKYGTSRAIDEINYVSHLTNSINELYKEIQDIALNIQSLQG